MANRFFSPSPEKAMKAVIQRRLSLYLSKDSTTRIYKAFLFAEINHRGQFRKSGEAYIHHPISVANILARLQMDEQSIVAALLHDVVEDTKANEEDLIEHFGEEVAFLVDGVTKIGKFKFVTKQHAEAENFRKMLMAMSKDMRVMIIKLADRLHNMRTMDSMKKESRQRISRQTLDIYAPIAERLGLYRWARELQDYSFKYLYPNRHRVIGLEIKKREGNRKKVVEKLETSLKQTLDDSVIKKYQIKGRRKTVYSTYKKMQSKKLSLSELKDIYAFRIIVPSMDDCYRTLGVIHNKYKPIPGKFMDYIAIPKVNGYQSLHTLVFGPFNDNFEVQIRTEEMDRVAESGVAAHWVYKTGDDSKPHKSNPTREWMIDLLDPDKDSGNPVEFIEHLKTDLHPDEVYVFTPKGAVKKMPRGATALDFAFSVHSDIGLHCTGARINNQLSTLPTVLKNGDNVEIITSKESWPTPAWLNYAVTGRARSKISHYLKNQTEETALKLGKMLLANVTKRKFFGRSRINAEQEKLLLNRLGLDTWSELLIDIGLGFRLPNIVAQQISQISEQTELEQTDQIPSKLVIKNTEGLLISYAKCCCPIPTESIIGIVTVGHGLVIHTSECHNIAELKKQPEKCLMVEWGDDIEKTFPVKLQVRTTGQRGDFAKIATVIAEKDCDILHVESNQFAGDLLIIDFLLDVKNRVHLAEVMRSIRRISGVLKMNRPRG